MSSPTLPQKPLSVRIRESGAKPRQTIRLVKAALRALDHDLGEAAEAIDKGELGIEDFAWEDEMEGERDAPTDGKQSD